MTFEHLDALLRRVSEDLDGTQDWPPPAQEKECIAVATLNLLTLQVDLLLFFNLLSPCFHQSAYEAKIKFILLERKYVNISKNM